MHSYGRIDMTYLEPLEVYIVSG
uniref:Uncharacterized protein n=1 Tax=Rhizophora mucronata TaxID=61149 RepID=A0A2P2PLU5_RHIMU